MFSVVCVCQSVCPQGVHVTIAHDALDHTIQGPNHSPAFPLVVTSGGQDLFKLVHLRNPPFPASPIWWPRPETSSNLFTWGGQCWHLVDTVARMVGERVLCLMLECCLVWNKYTEIEKRETHRNYFAESTRAEYLKVNTKVWDSSIQLLCFAFRVTGLVWAVFTMVILQMKTLN